MTSLFRSRCYVMLVCVQTRTYAVLGASKNEVLKKVPGLCLVGEEQERRVELR